MAIHLPFVEMDMSKLIPGEVVIALARNTTKETLFKLWDEEPNKESSHNVIK